MILAMIEHPAYRLNLPSGQPTPVLFNSPHSGAEYPDRFLADSRLDALTLRSSEDAFVDDLLTDVTTHGATLLTARLPRAFVDLNRAGDEMDPALIEGASFRRLNPRISAGLGVVPRVVAEGKAIRRGKISQRAARERVASYHTPYHQVLGSLLQANRRRYGIAVLFDCHSMPHDALSSAPMVNDRRPDMILGDRFGMSCERWVIDFAEKAFSKHGFTVARNAPFAGGYITQNYGKPNRNIHCLQIELDRSLYMDEKRIERSARFDDTKRRFSAACSELARIQPSSLPVAAE
jgi:N-formylglutamate deformylase